MFNMNGGSNPFRPEETLPWLESPQLMVVTIKLCTAYIEYAIYLVGEDMVTSKLNQFSLSSTVRSLKTDVHPRAVYSGSHQ